VSLLNEPGWLETFKLIAGPILFGWLFEFVYLIIVMGCGLALWFCVKSSVRQSSEAGVQEIGWRVVFPELKDWLGYSASANTNVLARFKA